VFIDPDISKTASFLIENGEPVSTVFFILMKWDMAAYAVTTHHSVCDSDLSIRFNLRSGGIKDKFIPRADWLKDRGSDVAVLPLDFMWDEFKNYEVKFVDVTELRSYLDHYSWGNSFPENHPPPMRYGQGDEVFSIGLFDRHFGDTHSTQPVARFGHIALVPALHERIWAEVEIGKPLEQIEAFLVEIASWEGQSGSPIFLRPEKKYGERTARRPRWEVNLCLGILQGFYPGEQQVQINDVDATLSQLNMGIGIVIPAKKITELLMRQDVKDMRQKAREEKLKPKPSHRPSAASKKPGTVGIGKTEFEGVLRCVSRKVSEPETRDSDVSE